MKFIGFAITVRNMSDSTVHVNPNNVTLVDLDGRTYSYNVVTFQYVDPLDAIDVPFGKYAGGMIAFHIGAESGPAQVIYEVGLFQPSVTVHLTEPPTRKE
jgi:hypothetical protein